MRKKKRVRAPTSHEVAESPTRAIKPVLIPAESGRRACYEPGGLFWWRGEPVKIERVVGSGFEIRRLQSGECIAAQFHELEPLPVGLDPPPTIESTDLAQIPAAEWSRAQAIEKVLRELLSAPQCAAEAETSAARELGISARHLRRLRQRYERNPVLSVLVRGRAGRKKGVSLLAESVELRMRDLIRRELKRSPDMSAEELHDLLVTECRAVGIRAPGRTAVAARLRMLRANPSNLPAAIGEELSYRQSPVVGSLVTAEPLELVQIDHTTCDVMIVDSVDREPIGRPFLTLAIDVHTRVILGMLLSLEAPSSLSVALCLQHAVFPKTRWLSELGIPEGMWPGFGLPRALHLDNAPEFHAPALGRGCEEYRIELIYRPAGDPQMGGVIERVIGTHMGKVRLIPGATYSKVLRGRPRKPERLACFTLSDLYEYLAREVTRYHLARPKRRFPSRREKWERAWRINGKPHYPQVPENAATFVLHFLPYKRRVITREGVPLFGLQYQSMDLQRWMEPRRKRVVRYDPRNLACVYVEADDRKSHLVVPLIKQDLPAFSLWEWREIRRRQLVPMHPKDKLQVERALQANRQLIHERSRGRGSFKRSRRAERERSWRATAPIIPFAHPGITSDPLRIASQIDDGLLPCDVLE